MDLKSLLIAEIGKIDELSNPFIDKILIEDNNQNEEIEQSSKQIEISRDVVIDYLKKSGYDLNQQNYDMAFEMLNKMEQEKLRSTLNKAGNQNKKRYKTVNHLFEFSTDELNALLNIAVLHSLNKINSILDVKYEYAVEVVKDVGGATDIIKLSRLLTNYSEKGYRVSNIFTNELGKDSISVGGVGVNSTADQVVIIFEKPIYNKMG